MAYLETSGGPVAAAVVRGAAIVSDKKSKVSVMSLMGLRT